MLSKFYDLEGAIVFITGGGSGIGATLVSAFVEQGALVTFVSISSEPAISLCDAVESEHGVRPTFIQCDIRDIAALKTAIASVESSQGSIDILINNAADDTRHSVTDYTVEDWDNSINTNLRPHFFSAQAVISGMQEKQKGSIINIGSNASLLGLPHYPSYVAAKAGIVGLTRALAREVGQHNIRVNALIPGWVMTARQRRDWATPEAVEECIGRQCLKKLVREEDVAQSALFLGSNASAMITGQSIIVDGGRA